MPATEQLNIRVTAAVKARFRKRAEREGMTQAELLEALLKQRGTLPAPDPPEEPSGDRDGSSQESAAGPAPFPAPEEARANLTLVLATKLGMPQALVRRAINRGAVKIAGVPWTSEQIPRSMLEQPLTYDGNPV